MHVILSGRGLSAPQIERAFAIIDQRRPELSRLDAAALETEVAKIASGLRSPGHRSDAAPVIRKDQFRTDDGPAPKAETFDYGYAFDAAQRAKMPAAERSKLIAEIVGRGLREGETAADLEKKGDDYLAARAEAGREREAGDPIKDATSAHKHNREKENEKMKSREGADAAALDAAKAKVRALDAAIDRELEKPKSQRRNDRANELDEQREAAQARVNELEDAAAIRRVTAERPRADAADHRTDAERYADASYAIMAGRGYGYLMQPGLSPLRADANAAAAEEAAWIKGNDHNSWRNRRDEAPAHHPVGLPSRSYAGVTHNSDAEAEQASWEKGVANLNAWRDRRDEAPYNHGIPRHNGPVAQEPGPQAEMLKRIGAGGPTAVSAEAEAAAAEELAHQRSVTNMNAWRDQR